MKKEDSLMNKRFLVIATTLSLAVSAAAITPASQAIAQTEVPTVTTFTGACMFEGDATLTPSIGLTTISAGYTFTGSGTCEGTPSGTATVSAKGSGMLSCSASVSTNGTGTLTINGVPISFKLTIVGTGPQVTVAAMGNSGGVATGQASFATDTTAEAKCAGGVAGSLHFVVAVVGSISG